MGEKKWRGIPLNLFIHSHHKDQDPNNSVDENLELVCANCHSVKHMFPLTPGEHPDNPGKLIMVIPAKEYNCEDPLVKKIIEILTKT